MRNFRQAKKEGWRVAYQEEWFAVRSVLVHKENRPWGPHGLAPGECAYEERITLWRAECAGQAMDLAAVESCEHAEIVGAEVSELFQAYQLPDPPSSGVEVFSLARVSSLQVDSYLNRFFDDGKEMQRNLN